MKVYVVSSEWGNEGSYEDYWHGGDIHGVCETLEVARKLVKKVVQTLIQEHKETLVDEYDRNMFICELKEIPEDEQKIGDSNLYCACELRLGDGHDIDTNNYSYYIEEVDILTDIDVE